MAGLAGWNKKSETPQARLHLTFLIVESYRENYVQLALAAYTYKTQVAQKGELP